MPLLLPVKTILRLGYPQSNLVATMWLLNTSTYQIVFVQNPTQAHYAILSHVWDSAGEQTFQDVHTIHTAARHSFPDTLEATDPHLLDFIRARLSPKIRCSCDYARTRGYAYLWIDTCCIDKTSSAELSEAINSMFTWYLQADVCYVFLSDVSASDDPAAQDSSFRRSMWFKRGWTLQELIVPSTNVFLSKDWRKIGTKTSLASVIEGVTGIDTDILLHTRQLHTVSVADRMVWAAGRETTRVEDEAYCLMGLFGVRLPVIYGEGSQAFVRLQEEIMRRIPDQSLFLWGMKPNARLCISANLEERRPSLTSVPMDILRASKSAYLFASCPMDFLDSKGFSPIPLGIFGDILGLQGASRPPVYTLSGHGVCATLPVCSLRFSLANDAGRPKPDSAIEVKMAILSCQDALGRIPALLFSAEVLSGQYLIGGFDLHEPSHSRFPIPSTLSVFGRIHPHSESATLNRSTPAYQTVRFSRSSIRAALLDPLVLKNVSSPAFRDICVPHQRMAAVSELAILRRTAIPKPVTDRFRGVCKFILPCWTLEHLSGLGFDTNVTVKDGEMVPVSLGKLPRQRTGSRSSQVLDSRYGHTFTLDHATHGAISVTIFTCAFSLYLPTLHATVTWDLRARHSSDVTFATQAGETHTDHANPVQEACAHEHINSWTDARRRFEGPPSCPSVILHFTVWDESDDALGTRYALQASGLFGDCYALDIRLELPPNNTANTDVSEISQLKTSFVADLADPVPNAEETTEDVSRSGSLVEAVREDGPSRRIGKRKRKAASGSDETNVVRQSLRTRR